MMKRKILILVLILLLFPSFSFAGEYIITKGKGVEVCEAYKKNLESFNEPEPMMCERKINPEFKDFEKPVWEKVDLEEHRELFRRVLLYYSTTGRIYFCETIAQFGESKLTADDELNRRIKDHKERGYPFISRTKFALTPYGKGTSDILIYLDGSCPDGPPYHASNLYVLIEDPSVKDAMIHAASPMEKLFRTQISPNSGTDTSVGLFSYKGVPYIDKYCISKQPGCTAEDTLIVFKYGPIPLKPKHAGDEFKPGDEFKLGFKKNCEYQYRNNK